MNSEAAYHATQAAISLVGMAVVVLLLVVCVRYPALARYPGNLIIIASACDALFALKFVIAWIFDYKPLSVYWCDFMAVYSQFTSVLAIMYHGIWGFHTLLQLFRRARPPRILHICYHAIAWLWSLGMLVAFIAGPVADDDTGLFIDGTCWIKVDAHWSVYYGYYVGPAAFALAICFVSFVACGFKLFHGHLGRRKLLAHHLLYLVVFLLCWGTALGAGVNREPKVAGVATVMAAPLLGLIRLTGPGRRRPRVE
eukprot:TRINITY_DN7063_c0_g1_i2.p1 TRINITY_DN7063_c0_g1~~TRINITY_DN7063_c0_g1_i2.p1  ORF type:complete len:254 (+),score=49.29 TRINITY_DN7063_c0_g1_i2:73-834(+)